MKVSVPYRGATFLNEVTFVYDTLLGEVSVPYRGATFLNSNIRRIYDYIRNGFRPLSGSYISQ